MRRLLNFLELKLTYLPKSSYNINVICLNKCTYKNELKVKEAGKMNVEGKNYIVKDGDVMHFLFNV